MDNDDSGPGAQREVLDLYEKLNVVFRWGQKGSGLGAAAWILWLRDESGSCENVSYGGRVLRKASAMTAEREALRMDIEHLTVLFRQKLARLIFKLKTQVEQGQT